MRFISHSEKETEEFGKKIAVEMSGGEVIALQGDLGAGKTILAKGIAQGLGYKRIVNSPTFVLMKIYKIRFNPTGNLLKVESKNALGGKEKGLSKEKYINYICHIDAYRIKEVKETEELGVFEYFGKSDTITILEWPERIKEILPSNTIWVSLSHGEKENEREIELKN